MFIISWFVILILRANEIIVPGIVSGLIGWLAILEATFYVLVILLQIAVTIKVLK